MKHLLILGMAFVTLSMAGCTRPDSSTPATAPAPTTSHADRPPQTPILSADTIAHENIHYGGPDQKLNTLDLYAPKGAINSPVLLFIHGGEWTKGDKRDVSYKPKFFNEHDIVFASANYRLSPTDKHPAQVSDVAHAIAWLKAHVAEYGGDPDQIFIMGHSAGCHLVTLVTLDPRYLQQAGLKPMDVRGVIAWSGGMYNLPDREQGTGQYPAYIRATFGDSHEAQWAASPRAHVQNASEAPRFLFASLDVPRSRNSLEAAQDMVEQINANGGNAKQIILTGKTHFTANHELGAPSDTSGQIILDFIRPRLSVD
ncbi:MAG: alpha/beta hydrolase [Phycisphaerales bacterium]|nr:alpha/beta hydrolase [Phycisphaerales bacterium]